MSNLKTKIKLILMLSLGFIVLLSIRSYATSISVRASTSSVAPNGTFTVTITGSDATGRVNISASNGTVSPSSVWVENNSQSVTVTAGSSGTVSVSASGELSSNAGVDQHVSGSASVKITGSSGGNTTPTTNPTPTPSTTKPTLTNLGIRPYDFSGFRSTTLNYSVNVPNDCTSVTVYATSANGTVSGTGAISLKEGTNRAQVTVKNANGSQTYTISINRANAEGEEVTNEIPEEDPNAPENPIIGLSALSIEGYTFDKEFATEVYEYTVEIEKALTQEELDQIKEKLLATANTENVIVEKEATLNEDGTAFIKIIVKNEEKQFSEYLISFKLKEKEEPKVVGAVIPTNNKLDGFFTGLQDKTYLVLGLGVLGYLIAMFMAIHAYVQTRRVYDLEDEYYDEEYEDGEELKTVSQYGKNKELDEAELEKSAPAYFEETKPDDGELTSDVLSAPKDDELYARYEASKGDEDRIHELDEEEPSLNTAKEAITRASRLSGYRNLRNRKSTGGRHF